MSSWSRAARRVLVMGAVVALGAALIAPAARAEDNGNGNGNGTTVPLGGVDVPGWEAAEVSGEAVGCHSEIELSFDFSVFRDNVAAADVTSEDVTSQADELLSQIPVGETGFLKDLLPQVQDQLQQQLSITALEDGGEDAFWHEEAGPVPTVKIPWQGGGPVTAEEDDCTLSLFGFIHIPLATDLKVSSEGAIGPAGYSHTSSESDDNLGLVYETDKITTECNADLSSIVATTTIEDGQYADFEDEEIEDIEEHPDVNEELIDEEFNYGGDPWGINFEFSLTANEQEQTDKAVTVTGLHSSLLLELTFYDEAWMTLTIDGIRDQSHCDIHPVAVVTPVEVEPKFTG